MINVYGIPNCDTIKKTLDYYKNNSIEYKIIGDLVFIVFKLCFLLFKDIIIF